jgi:membrane protein required for colicin V production
MAGIVSLQSDLPMEIQPLDIAAVAIIAAATLRGLFIGLIREGFSLASLGGAYMAVQLFTPPTADWLQEVSNGDIGVGIAPWVAGAGLAIGTVLVIVIIGRGLQRTLHAAGLSWADRAAGSLLGAAEGVLVAGILLVLGTEVLGRDHAAFSQTASLAALEEFERVSEESEINIDVAAPPRTF